LKLLLTIALFLQVFTANHIPEYTGSVIDLSTFSIASLYKGQAKQLIAHKQNAKDISDIISKEEGLWYVSLEFQVSEATINKEDIWLEFRSNIHAANLYINGKLILQNGIVDHVSPAKIGGKNIARQKILKENLTSGRNKIEIEFTNYKSASNVVIRDLSLGNLSEFQEQTAVMTTAPILFFGIFIFVFLINLVLYFSLDRKKVFLLLALLFLVNSLTMAYEVLYWNGFIASDSFVHSYTLRSGFEYLSYFLLLIVLFYEYAFSKKTIWIAAIGFIAVYLLASLMDVNRAIALSLFPFSLSLIAVLKKKKNSNIITAALFLLFILNYLDDKNTLEAFDFANSNYIITSLIYKLDSIGMIIFALVMIFISAKNILSKSKSLSQATLKLERLEYQFLQKLIVPHFMVNSLMSLQQLISKEPETARKMIEALSEEFHLLSKMSKKKLVPISQEIEMCKAHLTIMSIQQKAKYQIKVTGILGSETIPPTVIHTLIENGITHGYSGSQNAYFELSKHEKPNAVVYRLFNDSHINSNHSSRNSGTGLKHVEARLEECYPGKWRLHSHKVNNGWESTIEIIHT
jgi:hypothetical protein